MHLYQRTGDWVGCLSPVDRQSSKKLAAGGGGVLDHENQQGTTVLSLSKKGPVFTSTYAQTSHIIM